MTAAFTFTYGTPQEYPAVVHDRWGRFETTLVNDGQHFSLMLRGNRFEGDTLDGLEPAEPVPEGREQPPDLVHGYLISCTVEWRMPFSVVGVEPEAAELRARMFLVGPTPRRGVDPIWVELELHLPTGVVATVKRHGWMEDALLDLQGQLADGVHLRACITCAFSDYHPGGSGFIGSMACFRDSKDAYRTVSGKQGIFGVWGQRAGFVQEPFHCDQYERRAPNTGYRG